MPPAIAVVEGAGLPQRRTKQAAADRHRRVRPRHRHLRRSRWQDLHPGQPGPRRRPDANVAGHAAAPEGTMTTVPTPAIQTVASPPSTQGPATDASATDLDDPD